VNQHRAQSPLLTARSPASTIPAAWTVVAVCAAAASTSALELAATVYLALRAAGAKAATLTNCA
jgi:ABC-type lipoprotein release transport system permease subunit